MAGSLSGCDDAQPGGAATQSMHHTKASSMKALMLQRRTRTGGGEPLSPLLDGHDPDPSPGRSPEAPRFKVLISELRIRLLLFAHRSNTSAPPIRNCLR
jgi:hypothetical protein